MKNAFFWDIEVVFHRSVLRLLVIVNFVPISPILVTLMMEAIRLQRNV
jgi:hypothetical protein